MTEIAKIVQNNKGIVGNADPTHGTTFVSQGGVDYLIGSLFILLGITIYVLFQKKAQAKYEKYKQDQLDLYNKNRKTNVKDYSRTKLYVPFWEKAKLTAPIFLTILFVIVGALFILWTAFGTPSTTL